MDGVFGTRRGGQPGRKGVRLEPAEKPDRTEQVAAPADCAGCGADLGDARALKDGWAQVWDILPVVLEKVAYVLPRQRCGCGCVTTSQAPGGQVGAVVYGPNLNAAAVLLGSEGNIPVERTAMLINSLLGVPVSSGFVARAHARLAERLEAAGFDAAMKQALRAEDVLCGDESPVHVLDKDADTFGRPVPGTPHAVTVRTPDERLIWYVPMNSRSSEAIRDLDVLTGWNGYLVRDDYSGWQQFDATLAGVQQCAAHLIRQKPLSYRTWRVGFRRSGMESLMLRKAVSVGFRVDGGVGMASALGLLEERELAARERLEVVRAEADRILAELAHAERDWEDWITARQRVAAVLSAESAAPEATATAGIQQLPVPVVPATAVLAAPAVAAEVAGPEAGAQGPRAGSVVAVWGPGVEPGVLAVEYQRILAVLAERQDTDADGSGLMSCQEIASALGLELTPAKVEGVVRSRARRLEARGWLAQPVAGRFRLAAGPAAGS
ncbi:IS66 family transposase [Actinacidiphila oryziradicis]|uniref:Transposase IS66 central domain-containing protein n=1 Tax=Actinacidiphila oryziradicis TaxID=2571141 RepID=A0A4U0S828_9ACTN|nr:hypothetical protein FCI23_50655 [Actinacidiphila oryziradicis]